MSERLKNIFKPFWKGLIYEPFNYPYRKIIPDALYGKNSSLRQNARFLIGFVPVLRNFYFETEISERIIEDPFVISEISKLPLKSNVLDFGCYSSILPLQIASLGFNVIGIDLNKYSYKHPNFDFLNIDFMDNNFKNNSFDAIYAVSSLEHVGAGWYNNENKDINDKSVVDEFYRVIKKNGKLIITVPFGKRAKKLTDSRMYDEKSLSKLFMNFKVKKKEYFFKKDAVTWLPTDKNNLGSYNVACWVMEKK